MTQVEVFDPPMCCPTGVWGPSVDPLLAAFAADVEWPIAQGVTVVRHNLSLDPQPFLHINDPIAVALETRGRAALDDMPAGLRSLPRIDVPLLPFGLVGVDALRQMGTGGGSAATRVEVAEESAQHAETLNQLVEQIAARGKGVVMTMGKGGVGKTPLDAQGHALLEEDLRSPCTEEIAVFRASADTVAHGEDQIVAEGRWDVFAWVVNHSLTPLDVTDPVLRARRSHEAVHLRELATHGKRTALEPWHADILAADPVGA